MHVLIIGNGVAGVSAATRIRAQKPEAKITVVCGESRFHYSRPALMYVFLGHLRYTDTKPFEDRFWAEQRIDLVRAWVSGVDVEGKRALLHGGGEIAWDKLLIATGSTPNKFGWPGQDLDGVQGLYGLPDLKQLYANVARTKNAVIVGGGLIGIELAEMLLSRGVRVTFLIREPAYWSNVLNMEEAELVSDLVRHHGIALERDTHLGSIEDDGTGRCCAAIATDGRRFECQLVGLTAGVSPNVGWLGEAEIAVGRGVMVDATLKTSAPDVYAAGDCAEVDLGGERPLIQAVWYTGKMQGEVAADNICGAQRTYDPGVWFNSAKFFDLEYHTYGQVNRNVAEERNLYWEDRDRRLSARVVFTDAGVIGLQSMGIRWRHRVAESWIRERRPVEHVLDHLADLGFDPEFTPDAHPRIVAALREQL